MHHFLRLIGFAALTAAAITVTTSTWANEEEVDSAGTHLLEAEVALHADDYLRAVREYRRAAELSDSAEIARKATRTAFGFGFNEEALHAARRWQELDSDSEDFRDRVYRGLAERYPG